MTVPICNQSQRDLVGGNGLTVHHNRIGALVHDFKGYAGKISVALGRGPGLAVMLINSDTATHYIIFSGERIYLAILADRYLDFLRKGLEHGSVGGFFADDIITVWQSVGASSSKATGVSRDGSRHTARVNCVSIHHHRVVRIVDDLKLNTREVRITLGYLPGLTILLLYRNAAPDDILCHGGGGVVVFIVRPGRDNGELCACAAHLVALAGGYLTEHPVLTVWVVVGCELAVLVSGVLFHQGVSLIHAVLCSGQRAITLGSDAGLAISFGDRHSPLLQDILKVNGGGLSLGQLECLGLGFDIAVRHVYFCGGIGDLAAAGLIDGHSRHVDVAVCVRSDVPAAPIVAGYLELDTAYLTVSGGLFQAGVTYGFGLHFDITAHRFTASGVVGGEILLAAVAGAPDGHGTFAAYCCTATINAGRSNR